MYKNNSSNKVISSKVMARELLYKRGGNSLSDTELLQVMINSGTENNDFIKISRNVDAVISKCGIENLTVEDFVSIKGIGKARAAMLMAAIEYFRRRYVKQSSPLIDSPGRAAAQLRDIADKKQEHFVLLTLDGARRLIKKHLVTIGTLTASLVHPREVFALAIGDRAASILIAHNHPSGMLDVSDSDREVTQRIRQAGDIVGIRLDDHIIVADDDFVSAY